MSWCLWERPPWGWTVRKGSASPSLIEIEDREYCGTNPIAAQPTPLPFCVGFPSKKFGRLQEWVTSLEFSPLSVRLEYYTCSPVIGIISVRSTAEFLR
jgi:hypothetical protein